MPEFPSLFILKLPRLLKNKKKKRERETKVLYKGCSDELQYTYQIIIIKGKIRNRDTAPNQNITLITKKVFTNIQKSG